MAHGTQNEAATSSATPVRQTDPIVDQTATFSSTAPSTSRPSSQQVRADIFHLTDRYVKHIQSSRPELTGDAWRLQTTLDRSLKQGGTVACAFAAYKNGMTYLSQHSSPEMGKKLYQQIQAVRVLYEAINHIVQAQVSVLNGRQPTSLTNYVRVVTTLNDYLVGNADAVNDLLSDKKPVSRSIAIAVGIRLNNANDALSYTSISGRIAHKKEIEIADTKISSLQSFPSLSSSVAVPTVPSQTARTSLPSSSLPLPPQESIAGPAPISSSIPQVEPGGKGKKQAAEETRSGEALSPFHAPTSKKRQLTQDSNEKIGRAHKITKMTDIIATEAPVTGIATIPQPPAAASSTIDEDIANYINSMDAFATSSEAGIATIPQPPAAAPSIIDEDIANYINSMDAFATSSEAGIATIPQPPRQHLLP